MRLFYVRCDDENGENLDLFVWAETHAGAAGLWAKHYSLSSGEAPDTTVEIPTTPPTAASAICWSTLV